MSTEPYLGFWWPVAVKSLYLGSIILFEIIYQQRLNATQKITTISNPEKLI
jgi:hypothetical protein